MAVISHASDFASALSVSVSVSQFLSIFHSLTTISTLAKEDWEDDRVAQTMIRTEKSKFSRRGNYAFLTLWMYLQDNDYSVGIS